MRLLDLLGLVTYSNAMFWLTLVAIRWLWTFPFTQGVVPIEGLGLVHVPTLVNLALMASALVLFYPTSLIEPWHGECPRCPALGFTRSIVRNAVFCGALSINLAVIMSYVEPCMAWQNGRR